MRPTLLLALLPALAHAAAPSPFPTAPGATANYRHTTRQDRKPAATTESPLTVEPGPAVDNQPTLLLNKAQVVTARPDGYYLLGHLKGGKPDLFPEPALILPVGPKLGDKWTDKRPNRSASAACLGPERVTVPAGTFDAVKVYAVASTGESGDRTETTAWYAPDVGLVKQTTSTQSADKDGNLTTTQATDELVSFTPPGGAAPAAADAAPEEAVAKLFAEGEAAARAGDHAAALAKYDAALAKDPKAAKVLAYKAVSLTATRKYDAAAQTVAAALALNPKEYTYHEIAGQVKLAQGDVAAGLPRYDRAAALSPENAGAVYLDLAAALSARNDARLTPQIQAALEKSAAANPPHPDALFALGQTLANAGRSEGRVYLQRYLDAAAQLPADRRDAEKVRLAKQFIRALDAVKAP